MSESGAPGVILGTRAPDIRAELLTELRAAIAPFVAWLQEAEEDSDEE